MNAAELLAHLRAKGALVTSDSVRLVIEAPPGVVSAQMRGELAKCKAEVLALLHIPPYYPAEDTVIQKARIEVAGILTHAYHRYSAIPRVGSNQPTNSAADGLANVPQQSVHGVVR